MLSRYPRENSTLYTLQSSLVLFCSLSPKSKVFPQLTHADSSDNFWFGSSIIMQGRGAILLVSEELGRSPKLSSLERIRTMPLPNSVPVN